MIDPARFTLADLFKEQGYRTAFLGKWHLGFGSTDGDGWDDRLGPDYNRKLKPGPLELGFDYFWGVPHVGQRPHFIIENRHVLGLDPTDPIEIIPDLRPEFYTDYLERPRTVSKNPRLETKGGESALYAHEALSDRLTEKAVEWIHGSARNQPFFLYLAHRNIHGPLIPASRFENSSPIGPRGDFINEFDDSIGRVLKAIRDANLENDTLVIFTSDNGGVLRYEPIDYPEIEGHRINGPLRGQKGTTYEGGHRIPLLVRWPGVIAPNTESNALVALTDLFATFSDLFNADLPQNAAEDSFSFLETLSSSGAEPSERPFLIADSSSSLKSIRKGPWKLIPSYHGGRGPYEKEVSTPQGQLYHIERDLSESINEYERYPEIVAELAALLDASVEQPRTAPLQ